LGLVESEVGRLRGGDMESSARDEKLSGVKGGIANGSPFGS